MLTYKCGSGTTVLNKCLLEEMLLQYLEVMVNHSTQKRGRNSRPPCHAVGTRVLIPPAAGHSANASLRCQFFLGIAFS